MSIRNVVACALVTGAALIAMPAFAAKPVAAGPKVFISVDMEGIAGVVTVDQLGPAGFDAHPHLGRTCVLRRVRKRLRDNVIGGDFSRLRHPSVYASIGRPASALFPGLPARQPVSLTLIPIGGPR